MSKMSYRDAIRSALREALREDPRVFLMGEDVGGYGGAFKVSHGLLEEFGPERVRDTPLSENTFLGAGIGAALGGMRPIVEIMTVNFSLLALDQIVNNAATLRHMSGGQLSVPLVVRMTTGGGRQLAAQHSHSLEGWFAHIPGIKIVAPAVAADARGFVLAALGDPAGLHVRRDALSGGRGGRRAGRARRDRPGPGAARGRRGERHHVRRPLPALRPPTSRWTATGRGHRCAVAAAGHRDHSRLVADPSGDRGRGWRTYSSPPR
jgi:pyruvate dehydrogenase E1 component beta subunit